MNINKALRLIRIFHDMNCKQLAEKLNISASYISEIESGIKNPSIKVLEAYANLFEMPLSSLLFFCENVDEPPDKLKDWISDKVLRILDFIACNSAYKEES